MQKWENQSYGAVHAEIYDDWYGENGRLPLTEAGNPNEVANEILHLVNNAGGGPVLELGVGTGRLAIPMVERGLDVTGLDNSVEMLKKLQSKPSSTHMTLIRGDMANPSFKTGLENNSFALALIGFNTLFCLTTAEAQNSCIAGIARLLAPDGFLVIEAFVPNPNSHKGLSVRSVEADAVILDIAQFDQETQEIVGQRVEVTNAGNRLFPYHLRYATPEQMDAMATCAGLTLYKRSSNWSGATFDQDSTSHVSVWSDPTSSISPKQRT